MSSQRIVDIANALGVSVKDLTTDASMKEEHMTIEFRGTLSNRRSKMELKRLKFAVEDYIGLKGVGHEIIYRDNLRICRIVCS